MEIRRPAPHVLELHDSGALVIKIGAALGAFGIVAAVFAVAAHAFIPAVLMTTVFSVAGAACVWRARRSTHVLDARRGIMTIASQPVLGKSRPTVVEQHKLGELTSIELESRESSDSDGITSMVYRVTYVFANGERRPWSALWTSTRKKHEAARDAAVEFLSRTGYLGRTAARSAAGR